MAKEVMGFDKWGEKIFYSENSSLRQQFQKLNFDFLTIELENRQDCQEIQAVLGEMTGATSVPRVFVDGKFIGGGTDVKKLRENGELVKMLT